MKAKFTRSSGNIFTDLGFATDEALAHRVRSELMIEIRNQIKERKLTQQAAAEWLGVTQPRISDLVRSQFEKFSIDGLISMLGKAGLDVSLKVEEARAFEPLTQEIDIELPLAFSEIKAAWRAAIETGPKREITAFENTSLQAA